MNRIELPNSVYCYIIECVDFVAINFRLNLADQIMQLQKIFRKLVNGIGFNTR